MATTTVNWQSVQSLTVTNLHSLADGSFWQSGSIDNGTVAGDELEIELTIVTNTSAGDADGFIELFYAGSVDGGSTFAAQATGTEGSYANTANLDIGDADCIAVMKCDASETTARTYKQTFVIGMPAEDFVLLIGNQSGQGLGASANTVKYRLRKRDSA